MSERPGMSASLAFRYSSSFLSSPSPAPRRRSLGAKRATPTAANTETAKPVMSGFTFDLLSPAQASLPTQPTVKRGSRRTVLMQCHGAEVRLVGAALEDVDELLAGERELLVGVEEMGPESQSDVRPVIAEDRARGELGVSRLELGRDRRHGATAPLAVARASHLEACALEKSGQEVGLLERAPPDPVDADLLDHVVAGGGRVERGHVRRAGEEPRRPLRILELRLERERPRVRLPAHERRLELGDEVRAYVEPRRAGAAAEPLDAAADGE